VRAAMGGLNTVSEYGEHALAQLWVIRRKYERWNLYYLQCAIDQDVRKAEKRDYKISRSVACL
jgi:hypothetical protein